MRLPNAERALVPAGKIQRYLLDVTHPRGAAKARFFIRHGFEAARPHLLRRALLHLARKGRVAETVDGAYGTKYVVDGGIEAPSGEDIRIRTVWILLRTDDRPHLVTAYPRTGGDR